jgi:hypothetical protein
MVSSVQMQSPRSLSQVSITTEVEASVFGGSGEVGLCCEASADDNDRSCGDGCEGEFEMGRIVDMMECYS